MRTLMRAGIATAILGGLLFVGSTSVLASGKALPTPSTSPTALPGGVLPSPSGFTTAPSVPLPTPVPAAVPASTAVPVTGTDLWAPLAVLLLGGMLCVAGLGVARFRA